MTLLLAVLGPTASSKSAVALRIAERIKGRILSVDSMQVYSGMDIGTAKPTADERSRIPHGMLDLVEPEHEFTVAEFQAEARRFIAEDVSPVVIVGGSGLHFRSVVDPMTFAPSDPVLRAELENAPMGSLHAELTQTDPEWAEHVDSKNRRRVIRAVEILRLTGRTPSDRSVTPERARLVSFDPELPFRPVGLDSGSELANRSGMRVAAMREAGLLDEVATLADRMSRTAAQAVGYKQLLPVVAGETDEDAGFEEVERATVALARRQRTFFRRDPRIRWLDWAADPDVLTERALAAFEIEM